MNELNIKQKQELYDYLLTLDYPDLLAALIAERSDKTRTELQELGITFNDIVCSAFTWECTEEGHDFWAWTSLCLNDLEEGLYTLNGDGVWVLPDVVKSSTSEDFIAIGTNFNLDSEVETTKVDGFFDAQLEELNNQVFGYVEESYHPQQPQEYLDYLNKMKTDLSFSELTLWQKVKFYIGQLFYKV